VAARLAAGRADEQQQRTVVRGGGRPEGAARTGRLKAWGKPVPAAGMHTGDGSSMSSGMPGMDSSSGSMPGVMSTADMDKLMAARGTGFDKMFLTMMITHHQGAVTMAQQESTHGSNPDTVTLAKKIITDQQAEITQMKAMPAQL
jgi:uncharacterized protein (DUF305 family)